MHDEIRISADWRREMRVVFGREPEVAQGSCIVSCLLHGSKHQCRDRPLHRCAANSIDQLLEMLRPQCVSLSTETVAERADEGLELQNLLLVGRLMNTVQRWCIVLD